jgi:ABC-type sugar transport system ATPase subunit
MWAQSLITSEPAGCRCKRQAVVFLSSEMEEFLNLCTRVLAFRNGAISAEFRPPFDGHVMLNAIA